MFERRSRQRQLLGFMCSMCYGRAVTRPSRPKWVMYHCNYMGQIAIYLDDETEKLVKRHDEGSGEETRYARELLGDSSP